MCISFAVALCLSACVTSSDSDLTLERALSERIAVSVPMEITEKGLIVIKDVTIDDRPLKMIVDTGATHSAIFQTTFEQLAVEHSSDSETMVHGMIESKSHRVVKVSSFEVGSLKYLNKPMVVLDDRNPKFFKSDIYDGLIGMDILSQYQLYISPEMQELRFIPNSNPVLVPPSWPQIELIKNPFQDDSRSLHFLKIRVDGRNTPALLDTGSEFNSLNWAAASYVQFRAVRRKLRKAWELQGAVGVFRPRAHAKLGNIRSGQVFWDEKDFLVLDYESLEVLGFDDEPFIIAGMNLFANESIFIDFNRDILAVDRNRSQ